MSASYQITSSDDFIEPQPYVHPYKIQPLYYGFIVMYIISFKILLNVSVWKLITIYLGIVLSTWFWHKQAHERYWFIPFNEECIKFHNIHHEIYSCDHFYGVGPQSKTHILIRSLPFMTPFKHEAFLYMMLITLYFSCYMLNYGIISIFAGILLALILIIQKNYLHIAFHVKDFWMVKYKSFRELRWIHYCHHLYDFKQNYGFIDLLFDKFFETYFDDLEILYQKQQQQQQNS